jgi:hypothetical protein
VATRDAAPLERAEKRAFSSFGARVVHALQCPMSMPLFTATRRFVSLRSLLSSVALCASASCAFACNAPPVDPNVPSAASVRVAQTQPPDPCEELALVTGYSHRILASKHTPSSELLQEADEDLRKKALAMRATDVRIVTFGRDYETGFAYRCGAGVTASSISGIEIRPSAPMASCRAIGVVRGEPKGAAVDSTASNNLSLAVDDLRNNARAAGANYVQSNLSFTAKPSPDPFMRLVDPGNAFGDRRARFIEGTAYECAPAAAPSSAEIPI